MIDQRDLKQILFLDIETVSEVANFSELSEDKQYVWKLKSRQFSKERSVPDDPEASAYYEDKAGIFAEFAKVVCISVGYLVELEGIYQIRLKSFASDDELEVLENFKALLDGHYNNPNMHKLCGHNINEFDIPFLSRRYVINQLELPILLQISGKKPWQITHMIDTLVLWRFGDYKNYTSLVLLATTLGVASPKDDIDGSQVGSVYWQEQDLPRIAVYCQKDVVTVIQVLLKMIRMPLVEDENIQIIEG